MIGVGKNVSGTVQSVERALAILELLDGRGELAINDIARALRLERSTAYRLVYTLKHLGYVTQNRSSHTYANSFKLFEIGNNVVKRLGLRKQAQPFMRELSEKTGEAINLAIMDGKHVVYIDKIDSVSTFKIDLTIGRKMPAYCTGLGKALLACMDDSAVVDLLAQDPFVQHTENTISDMESLLADLRETRERGYAVDRGEFVDGLLCFAVPIRGYNGAAVAAVSVALLAFRSAGKQKKIDTVVRCLRDVAHRFSLDLGYTGNSQ
ncbi:MAG: IclR family transcriptional regulator [Dethiosulfovibrio peptidovorans]|nr:MAG: IclR family transcriptional regulator [Dethiosulfovibrio peptidovorans]